MTENAKRSRRRVVVLRLLQAVVIGAAIVFLWTLARTHRADLSRVPFELRWLPLIAATAAWFVAFATLVATWARSLDWWGQRMRSLPALRIFFLSNLARYVPGALWQFAGLAAMSSAQGVSPAAATSAVLVQQGTLLVTGLALSIALAPAYLAPLAARAGLPLPGPAARVGIALVGVAVAVLVAPRMLEAMRRLASRWMPDIALFPELTIRRFARYALATVAAWIVYGVAFALFARATLGDMAPPAFLAGATYVAAYVAGIIWIFVPGGLGVRESALVVGLAPTIGYDRALFLAIASRVWLVALEILGALLFLRGVPEARPAPAER
ncbi:MAG TPA: lysylphosphatidylglycerol synthase domain-containing protein [Gemmatimonadaceae bacterium]|nr:lysylphosphatidylglycerol synthase domain-containing protein [Gemmatimonadaceae bacterium]